MEDKIEIVILGLDDDALQINMLNHLLKANGIENFKLFTDYHEYIAALTPDVNIAILDYNLDDIINGLDIMRATKEYSPDCKIIMMSSFLTTEMLVELINGSLVGYESKSIGGINRIVDKSTHDYQHLLITFIQQLSKEIQDNYDRNIHIRERMRESMAIYNQLSASK